MRIGTVVRDADAGGGGRVGGQLPQLAREQQQTGHEQERLPRVRAPAEVEKAALRRQECPPPTRRAEIAVYSISRRLLLRTAGISPQECPPPRRRRE